MVFVQGLCVQKETLLVSCVIIMYHDHIIIIILIVVLNNNRDRDQQRERGICIVVRRFYAGYLCIYLWTTTAHHTMTYSEVSSTLFLLCLPFIHPHSHLLYYQLVMITWQLQRSLSRSGAPSYRHSRQRRLWSTLKTKTCNQQLKLYVPLCPLRMCAFLRYDFVVVVVDDCRK